MRVLAAVAVSVGLLVGSAVAMADNTGLVKLVSFENPQNGLGAFTYRWTLGATINSVTRVDHPAWAATGDGAAQINCTFGGYGDKAVAGATFFSASSGSAGMNLANSAYNYLLAAVAVDNNATFVPNGLIIKLYDKTGPGWLYHSGGDEDIASANAWYLLAWPISGAGDLTDVRELGIDMWSDTQYSGNVYVNFLGVSPTNVPEPATLSLLALGGLLIARRRRVVQVLPVTLVAVGLLAGLTNPASADVFNMGGTRDPVTGQWTGNASLEFVAVGDPGNQGDTRYLGGASFGAVPYTYQMGKYDVTIAQYCQFLNAVAKTDTYGLYNSFMHIVQLGSAGQYTYSVPAINPNFPMTDVSWGDAVRFCNWLSHGQPVGVEDSGTTETGSYTLNGATTDAALMAVMRSPGATYVIPSEHEWYKAAYYKGGSTNAGYWDYPTRSDTLPSNLLSSTGTNNANYFDYLHYPLGTPAGFTDPTHGLTPVGYFAASPSPYGAFDMGGNVWQWDEKNVDGWARGLRGGSYCNGYDGIMRASDRFWTAPSTSLYNRGFRVALVPEPATLSLLALGGLLIKRRRM